MNPDQPSYGGYTPPPLPPRKSHKIRNFVVLPIAAFVVLITVIAVATAGAKPAARTVTSPSGTATATAAPVFSQQPADTPDDTPEDTPSTQAAPVPVTVVYSVSGTGAPTIQYGTDSDNRDGGGTLGLLGEGNRVPWHKSLKFDPDADYYTLTAQLEGSGDITCKIAVSYSDGSTLTVATGHASGSYNICSAQAASEDSGQSWMKE